METIKIEIIKKNEHKTEERYEGYVKQLIERKQRQQMEKIQIFIDEDTLTQEEVEECMTEITEDEEQQDK